MTGVRETRQHYQYTDLDKEPGGLRRLELIVAAIDSFRHRNHKESLRVLDIGCGNGQISIPLAGLGYDVVGIDSDPRSVETARDANPFGNASFLVQDASALQVEGQFDAVICCEVLEHLPEPLLLLQSMSDVLAEDGVLLVTIPNGYTVEQIVRRFLTRTKPGLVLRGVIRRRLLKEKSVATENVQSPHLQYFTLGGFRSLVGRSQLRIAHEANWTTFFLPLHYVFLRLFVERGSPLFRRLDDWDAALAHSVPTWAGGGWFFVLDRGSGTGTTGTGDQAATRQAS